MDFVIKKFTGNLLHAFVKQRKLLVDFITNKLTGNLLHAVVKQSQINF
jgi:hypothetical protein